MSVLAEERQNRWQQILVQLEREYRALSSTEQEWIADRLMQIDRLQMALDQLFSKAGGEMACATCEGACCAKGHYHATLPNVLSYLQWNNFPPQADFDKTCPWLGVQGCVHDPGKRPYNCITFLCDKLEEPLATAEVEEFYRLDRELRKHYLAFVERYEGAGMTGLLLQAARLDGRPFLSLKPECADSIKRQEPA